MPAGDGTGPQGTGPRSGRGAGFCSGYDQPGFTSAGGGWRAAGRGFGRAAGWGAGRGWRAAGWGRGVSGRGSWFPPQTAAYTPDPDAETQTLEQQANWLKTQLQSIENRLSDLKSED